MRDLKIPNEIKQPAKQKEVRSLHELEFGEIFKVGHVLTVGKHILKVRKLTRKDVILRPIKQIKGVQLPQNKENVKDGSKEDNQETSNKKESTSKEETNKEKANSKENSDES